MRTVGVEEELLLVDARSDRPLAVGSRVLEIAADHGDAGSDEMVGGRIELELQEQQLETDTPPVSDLVALEAALRSRRAKADAAAREAGARIVATGTSPFPVEPQLVPKTRYEQMAERFGLTATEQLVCGCHVHVSVESDDEAIGVLDRIRVWLPPLLALSANSPFWQGTDTRYASFRAQTMIRWPISGPTGVYLTAASYRDRVAELLATGVLLDEAMIYTDARPSHRYPTVEIRVADVCLDARDAVLVAALCRALVDTAASQWGAVSPRRRRRPSCCGSPPGWPRGRESAATFSTRICPARGRPAKSSANWSSTVARRCAVPRIRRSSKSGSTTSLSAATERAANGL